MKNIRMIAMGLIWAASLTGADWTAPVEVRHDEKLVMTYRAQWDGSSCLVRGTIQPGWHTFVMDNKATAAGALERKAVARYREKHRGPRSWTG